MCSMSVLCPLCAQTSFSSIDALRCSLIKAANGPLACPICHELFLGLDKLTIHLFSHTNIMNANDSSNNIKQIPKISATPTTATSANTTKNSNNKNSNQQNNEKLKTNEDRPMVSENNIRNLNLSAEEANFENTHQQQQQQQHHQLKEDQLVQAQSQRTATKKNKTFKTDRKTNKKPQVYLGPENDVTDSPAPPSHPNSVVNTLPATQLATCDICEFTFRNEELRDMHVRLVHQNFVYTNVQTEHTTTCNGTTTTLSNQQFSPQVSEPDFKCHLCSKTFKMKGSLRVHLKVVHLMGLPYVNNSPKLSICDRIRHKETKQMKALNVTGDALSSSLPVSNLYNLQPITLISNLPGDVNAPNTLGNISAVNFAQSSELISNALEPNNSFNPNVLLVFNNSVSGPQIPQTMSNSNPTADTADKSSHSNNNSHCSVSTALASALNSSDNPKIWECDVCSKAFTTKYFLKKHKRLHTGEMPYTCELCARTFTFQQSYHKHLLYHSDEKPHVCSTCGRAFKELSTLHNHERIHSGEKPFKCDVCGKSFRQRVSFLVHTRIHTGVMPYKCEICQKSFRYKVSQRTHKCQLATSDESPTQNETTATNNLDHISENFIKAFLENTTTTPNSVQLQHSPPQNSPASNEIADINEKALTSSNSSGSPPSTLNEQQALLSKTIDDIVVESCNKLGIGSGSFSPVENVNEGSMSPSQKLQNMRLYSPQMVTPDLNGIEGDLTRFFLENSSGGQNIL